MDKATLQSAIEELARRDLEKLQALIAAQLDSCILCGREGSISYRITGKAGDSASLKLCKPCFEKYRLPASRAENP